MYTHFELILTFSTKAVVHGALSWYLDNSVSVRVSKYHYGTKISLPWSSVDSEMIGRPRFTEISDEVRVHGGWSSIVAKVRRAFMIYQRCRP
jgi:hypothetical protein